MSKRSQEKRITKEAEVIRYMRLAKKLSLNQAGKAVGISGSAIAHMEQGRMDISGARLRTLIAAFGFTDEQFLEFMDGKTIPKNLRDECLNLIRLCSESKLAVLHPVIANIA